MGILDDAIREHLDLKRRLGAASDELERLEKEAFGPPSRPGDPDFPATETATGEQAQVATEEPPSGEDAGEPSPTDERSAEPPSFFDGEQAPPAEPIDEVAAPPEQSPATEEAPFVEAPPEEPGDAASSLEQAAQDLDLDLDLDEEIEEVSDLDVELAPETPPEPGPEAEEAAAEPPAPVEPPVESLPTVEHHFEDALDEAEVVEGDEPTPPAASKDGAEDEDVLEETPEFLRENPDDDELWFEQGEPKDFDF